MRLTWFLMALLAIGSGACVSDRNTQTIEMPPQRAYHKTPYRAELPLRSNRPRISANRHLVRKPARQLKQLSWFPSKRKLSTRWTTIVIHHSGTERGNAKEFDRFHREKRGWDELGYHFVIGNGKGSPDGRVEVGPRWGKQKHGAHCKTRSNYYNEHGIGVCLVGDFTKTRPTPKQLASLSELVRFLSRECDIAPSRVTTHDTINSKTKCPGRHFALGRLRQAVSGRISATSMP